MSANLMNSNVDLLPGIVHILDDARNKIQMLTGSKVHITISENPKELSDDTLQYLVCREFQVSWKAMKSTNRSRKLVDARMVYIYLAHTTLRQTKVKIGIALARHHSSIIHLFQRVNDLINVNDPINRVITKIEKLLTSTYERFENNYKG